jgi:hypothetical protein
VGFEFVSTSGALGNALDISPPLARPGGGLDLVLGNGYVLGTNKTLTQSFVVKVGDDVAPGVYYNNVEVFCANLGNFVKGLDAPVTVTGPATPSTAPSTASVGPPELPQPQPEELPRTGGTFPVAPAGALLALILGTGLLVRRVA